MNPALLASDRSLPRFLIVSPRRARGLEAGLARFLALGCPLAQARTAYDLDPATRADLVLFDLVSGSDELRELRTRLGEAIVMVFGPAARRKAAEEALALGAHEWLWTSEGGDLDEDKAFDRIERLLLLGPRPALPRKRPKRRRTVVTLLQAEAPVAPVPEAAVPEVAPSKPAPEPPVAHTPSRSPAADALGTPVVADAAFPQPVAVASLGTCASESSLRARLTRVIEVSTEGGPARRPAPRVLSERFQGTVLVLELECAEPFQAESVVASVEEEGHARWVHLTVRTARALEGHLWSVELVRARGVSDLLRERALLPTLDPATMRYRRPELGERAREWAELGVLREVELDRVLVCPRCQALATFRLACRRCASARIEPQRLIHHFPCAHVGFIKDYQLDGKLVCPKCAAQPLIVNSDFEYLEGPALCADCGSHESEGELVGHCFGCALRFLTRVAATLTLKGFDVDRLDPLALGLPSD
jgi:hypothetical protein